MCASVNEIQAVNARVYVLTFECVQRLSDDIQEEKAILFVFNKENNTIFLRFLCFSTDVYFVLKIRLCKSKRLK